MIIREKYMEQIISALSKAGMVNSVRGAGGGYRLSREPKEYTVGMILRATEGSLAPVTCLTEGEPPCERAESCSTLYVWEKIYRAVNDVVDSITLADLIERENVVLNKDAVIERGKLPEGEYMIRFMVKDIFNTVHYSDYFNVHWDGETVTFPDSDKKS